MGNGIFGIGISGLAAAQAGLTVTGHNIANADTPGFHRQRAVQSNAIPQLTGAGFVGRGVQVDTVRRIYSDYLEQQVGRSEAQASYYATYGTQVAQLNDLLSASSTGLAPAMQAFFEAVNEVTANTASMPSRQAMVSAGDALAARMHALDARLTEIETGINAQIESTVTSVNGYAREIARLNARILGLQSIPNQAPNDLLDRRDQLVLELNKLVGASAVVQSNGSLSVSVGTGQPLVVGTQAFALAAVPSPEFSGRLEVAYDAGAGRVLLSERMLNKGNLGALFAVRGETLTNVRNELGRVATGLAQSFNAQHRLGQDLRGVLGGDFFVQPQPLVRGNTSNTGTAVVAASITTGSALTASDYRLVYIGAGYQLTRLSDNTTTSYATLPQTVDGITIQLSGGAPANGDSFLIEPTRAASGAFRMAFSDPGLIASAAPIRTGSSAANSGNAAISAGVVNAPLNVNVQQPVTITFTSATTFNVTGTGTGNPVGVAYTAGSNITYNGWTVQISGTPAAGDTFTVSSNTNGTADNRNALLLADVQSTKTLNGGTSTYHDAYGQITTAVGNTTRETQISGEAHAKIAQQARTAQQSLSGVNLDEEAANLLRYQQAYQASGKVIEIASTLFDAILAIGR